MLAPNIEEEIAALAARYGEPCRINVTLTGAPFRPLSADDRIGEVCMVVRRRNGKLITAVKTFYPPDAFRLLTGGVDHGEAIETALLREIAEETGLDVTVRRFLTVIEYRLPLEQGDGEAGRWGTGKTGRGGDKEQIVRGISLAHPPTYSPAQLQFVTFAFLVDEIGGTFGVVDEDEQIGAFREVVVDELPAMADTLDNVADGYHPEIEGSWADWGHFRAVVHRAVYKVLTDMH